MHMTLEGILGNIGAVGYSFGQTQVGPFSYGGGGSTGKVQFQDFHIKRKTDEYTSQLLAACGNGKKFPNGKFFSTGIDPESKKERQLIINLTDIVVTSISINPESDESVSFSYEKMSINY